MSKKFKSQASSARAASALTGGFGFGSSFQTTSSPLSYVTEQPDLSKILEPNVVVAFKNLGKKDSTTKAKALEELQESLGDIEPSILQAWTDIYPRTSIDNSRRVRQLAHTLQGNLTVSTGKKIVPHLPKVVGPWLAGTFDSDRSVSKSAQDALERAFTTSEKRKALWSLYKDALFSYIEDAVTIQTVGTLSDERTTSADDAQAKYIRVVATAMSMLVQLIKDGITSDLIFKLLNEKKVWEFAYHSDSYLRRTACDLVMIASEKYADHLDWTTISTCFLSKGLHSNQTGSSRQYTAALLALTPRRPTLWTSDYTAKTAISKRLMQFLRQGSQTGPEDVWSNIAALIKLIPQEVWLGDNTLESATALAEALRTGVTQQTERINAPAAWATYVQTCLWISERLDGVTAEFLNQELIPIVKQYVARKEDQQWNLSARAPQICKGLLIGIVKQGGMPIFENAWADLTTSTIDAMKLSQPETSKEFQSSQNTVVDQARRLFNIKKEISITPEASKVVTTFNRADKIMMDAAIQLLRTRNGKPYSAASVIEMIVDQPTYDRNDSNLQAFLNEDVTKLFSSPSSESLASVSLTCGHRNIIKDLSVQTSPNSEKALCRVLTRAEPEDINLETRDNLLKGHLTNSVHRQKLLAVMQNSALSELHSAICQDIRNSISTSASQDSTGAALTLIEELLGHSESAAVVTSDEYRNTLLSSLLVIVDSGSILSERASTVINKLNSKTRSGIGSTSIIQQQMNGEGTPLSIFTLLDLAKSIANTDGADLNAIIPTQHMWDKALLQHIDSPHPFSLTLTNPLQGVLYMVKPSESHDEVISFWDQDEFSLAFRLVLYVTKLLTSEVGPKFSSSQLQPLYASYPVALQLVNDKLTVENANELWRHATPEVLQEAADALGEGNKIIRSWLGVDEFSSPWMSTLRELNGSDLVSYTSSTVWVNVAAQYVDQNGPSQLLQQYESDLKIVHKSDNMLRSAALLAVLREYFMSTSYGKRVLNELVADCTELKEGSIRSLVLLNILLNGDSESLEAIPTQRVVFLLKNLVHLAVNREVTGVQSETMKLLAAIVPQVQDIYGEHWEQMLDSMATLLATDIDLPTMNACVRLYAKLKSLLKVEHINEDLQDAWTSVRPRLESGLLECLQQLGQGVYDVDQPRTITAELVRRQMREMELETDSNIFVLLSSPVEAVQSTAFEILHRAIPQQQEQLSVELILENKTVRLPGDLTTLVADDNIDLRKYMLAWKLIFDHFSKASYKLREAYTGNIKEGGNVDKLLSHITDILRIISGRPVNASKFDIVNFSIDEADSPEREIQWLAIHNYYNSLLYVPSLAKDWFISQKNRVKSPMESWTQQYISPLIVSASLLTVTDWAAAQSYDDDDRPLAIKSSPRGAELVASIAVDPESPPISLSISLPSTYPLESPSVTSRTRVGVSEKNWQSWLRTIQIIVFSTGSIIEGLVAFRRNVQGALKGQSECAICYSIIGTDMQTPNKKCGTCKNIFHGSCLFRWFKSSNSSSCPLCRNNFSYA